MLWWILNSESTCLLIHLKDILFILQHCFAEGALLKIWHNFPGWEKSDGYHMSLAKSGKLNLEAMVLPANSHRSHWRSIWKQFLYVGYKDEPYDISTYFKTILRMDSSCCCRFKWSLPCFRSGSTISSTGTAPSRNTFAFSLKSADNQPRIIWKRKRILFKVYSIKTLCWRCEVSDRICCSQVRRSWEHQNSPKIDVDARSSPL